MLLNIAIFFGILTQIPIYAYILANDSQDGSNSYNEIALSKIEGKIVTFLESKNNSNVRSGNLQLLSNVNVTKTLVEECPSLDTAESLTQTELIKILTAPCRYDRFERPRPIVNGTTSNNPLEIFSRAYIYVLQNLESSTLQFKVQGLFQIRYVDPRLAFDQNVLKSPKGILGEADLRSLIWVPHIFLANEHDSSVLGTSEKDILTSIAPDGTVIISSRVQATLFCWMDLRKFPFDEQECSTVFESWMYNSSELMLHWENESALTFDPKMHLTEYILQNAWTNESIVNADLTDLRHGIFAGNYSSLSFTVYLTREVGYYVMEYFLPSMMIVAISWVSFWLQADQTPARTTLGTSTLLSFITLASSQENNLPKVSYIKISEVWFFGCTAFIFGSLVEFAFVNTIWRRKRSLALKKITSKHILKSTLTPTPKRRKFKTDNNENKSNFSSTNSLRTPTSIVITSIDDTCNNSNNNSTIVNLHDDTEPSKNPADQAWATMTPHEVSLWIDRKSRFAFPLAFLIFNALFWTFVYCL